MKKILLILFIINIIIVSIVTILLKNQSTESKLELVKKHYSQKHIPTVDHTKFAVLQQKFKSPQDVTKACLSCHNERGIEVMHSSHWTWNREEYIKGRGVVNLGKKNILNNFCIGISGSEQSCNRCHAGYGWKDKNFDFTKQENIDCLVCHDNTGEYTKATGGAGMPDSTVDLSKTAQHVGLSQKANCGSCHFFGGGGNNVKHGDLEKAQLDCSRDVDVHMSNDGTNLRCADCHTTEHHQISGKMYSVSSMNKDRVSCIQCHSQTPHKEDIVNEHSVKVSCQACHIPTYAKVNSTKLYWNWSTAGKLKNGEEIEEDDSLGNHTYMSIKGSFVWGKDLVPDYVWFNGTADHYIMGDKVDTTKPIQLNTLNGDYSDPNSQIIPVKTHRAKQIYDTKYNQIIEPKLFSAKKGDGGYWKDFNWDTACKIGMENIGEKYSGHYAFVRTQMYWPLNHMVAPGEKAVSCIECHSSDGRLRNLSGFYLPGRDENSTVELLGIGAILISIIGVVIHALVRIFSHRKYNKQITLEE
jgi:octaheme c-type cytochrome (tetrathionate reductase family)